MIPAKRTAWITTCARKLGLDLCGVAPIGNWPELEKVPEWLERGYGGEMRYLHDARRQDPASILSGVRSVIVCALNYNSNQPLSTEVTVSRETENEPRGWISRYAWGTDYHRILMQKLESLLKAMRVQLDEGFEARIYVDTGPILERVAATHAGLGWLGKNTCLINQDLGSWLFLGVILTTLDCAPSLDPGDFGPADLCGNCTLCLDACPTEAITEPYVLDARRCISYLTIELRGIIPNELRKGMGEMVFGCDICQDVCPWNRRAPYSELAEFLPRHLAANHQAPSKDSGEMPSLAPSLKWLASLDEQRFNGLFRGSAIRRTKWRGMVRNACIALGNSRIQDTNPEYKKIMELLEGLAASPDGVISEHARWALGQLEKKPLSRNDACPSVLNCRDGS